MAIKPVIEYKARKIPINGTLNISIVMKKITKNEYVNWKNRIELVNYIDELYAPPTSDTYLLICCQCGREYRYIDKTEIPSFNLVCQCGRKIIEYSEN